MYFDEIFAIKSLGENQISHCAIPFIFFKAKISWKHWCVILLFPRKILLYKNDLTKMNAGIDFKMPVKNHTVFDFLSCNFMGKWWLTQNQFSLEWPMIWPNKKIFALCTVCSVQKKFCLNIALASQEKRGSVTGKF